MKDYFVSAFCLDGRRGAACCGEEARRIPDTRAYWCAACGRLIPDEWAAEPPGWRTASLRTDHDPGRTEDQYAAPGGDAGSNPAPDPA